MRVHTPPTMVFAFERSLSCSPVPRQAVHKQHPSPPHILGVPQRPIATAAGQFLSAADFLAGRRLSSSLQLAPQNPWMWRKKNPEGVPAAIIEEQRRKNPDGGRVPLRIGVDNEDRRPPPPQSPEGDANPEIVDYQIDSYIL